MDPMSKSTSTRRKRSSKAAPQAGSGRGGRRRPAADPVQSEWDFEEVRAAAGGPRCEFTGVNVDLHLVAYRDSDTGEFVARILGGDYRHLVRHRTTVSVPLFILSAVTLRQLEKRRKIPLGSPAVRLLREWLGRGSDGAWGKASAPKQLRQVALDLEEDSSQPLFQLI